MRYLVAIFALLIYLPVLIWYSLEDLWEFKMKPLLRKVV